MKMFQITTLLDSVKEKMAAKGERVEGREIKSKPTVQTAGDVSNLSFQRKSVHSTLIELFLKIVMIVRKAVPRITLNIPLRNTYFTSKELAI
ncbi:hypothetical protein JTB14_002707 [Gonioctena quinquepunctata]|nr:hypothetical protein JTB14_002707 [Gonioctena quinquepunctata]